MAGTRPVGSPMAYEVAILLPNAALRGARVVRRLECSGVLIRSLWSGPREKPPTNQAQAC